LASNSQFLAKPEDKSGAASPAIQALEFLGVQAQRSERPSTEHEAQQILAQAFQKKQRIFPCGGGTSTGVGVLPETVDVALDTTGMDRVLAFDPQNLNLAVLAGMTVDAINEFLAGQGKGFFLPLDPPLSHKATIGGVYATNSAGPSRLRYGTIRDQVLGVRGADAQGREMGFGGKTVKNVSGYDLTKFFIGSAGSLGLITSMSFRVLPLPDASSFCEFIFGSLEDLEKFLAALRTSILVPSAVVVTEAAAKGGAGKAAGLRFRVLISFEGHKRAVERQNQDSLNLARESGGTGEAKIGRDPMMKNLRAAYDPDEWTRDSLALKVTVPIARGPRTFVSIGELLKECGLEAKIVLFAGSGVIPLYVKGTNQEGISRFIAGAKEIGQAAGGYATPLWGPRKVLSGWGPRVEPALYRLILQPLKNKLDPSGVFPPVI
jgi:glycolate oxidase FAD binding subunit